MGLKDVGAKLPPGFRFHPSDEELVCHYLRNKIKAKSDHYDVGDDDEDEALKTGDLVEIDLHTCEPWQLPEVAKLNANEWYFFSFRDRKYATGYRTNRATTSGYWKATGKDRTVVDPRTKEMVGMRKTLVFYKNRAPNGIKTSWIMHEFRLECPHMPPKEDWVLCRVFNKSKASVPQEDNNHNLMVPKFTVDEDSVFNFNYTNLAPPPPSISSSLSPPSISTVDHHHHNRQMMMMKMAPCGPSDHDDHQLMTSSSSLLLNMGGTTEDDYGSVFWEMMRMERTGGMGSDGGVSHLGDDLRFEIDNTIAFQ